MKILTHRILIAVVCLSALFLGCIEEENHKIELPIDTPEEAIEYAKTDNSTKEWIERWSDYEIIEDAEVDNQSIWLVQLKAMASVEEQPILFRKIHSNGTILFRFGAVLCKEKKVKKTLIGGINIEPILKNIIESDFQPSSEFIKIQTTGKIYKVPPDVGETVLVNLYTPNKPSQNLYNKLEILGADSSTYYQGRGSIKVRIPMTNVTKISSLSEITDIRRVINFPLMTQEYNIRVENSEQYYHVFLDVKNHSATDAMIKTLENFGVIIIKQYSNGITDFRVYIPLDNLITIAELPFVTHIEFHDIPVEFDFCII